MIIIMISVRTNLNHDAFGPGFGPLSAARRARGGGHGERHAGLRFVTVIIIPTVGVNLTQLGITANVKFPSSTIMMTIGRRPLRLPVSTRTRSTGFTVTIPSPGSLAG